MTHPDGSCIYRTMGKMAYQTGKELRHGKKELKYVGEFENGKKNRTWTRISQISRWI